MAPKKIEEKHQTMWLQTTIGEFVEAVYEAAMEEYMDEILARRIAMQMLVRKLRLQHKMEEAYKEHPEVHQFRPKANNLETVGKKTILRKRNS